MSKQGWQSCSIISYIMESSIPWGMPARGPSFQVPSKIRTETVLTTFIISKEYNKRFIIIFRNILKQYASFTKEKISAMFEI